MKLIYKIKATEIIVMLMIVLLVAACSNSEFLDINTDPNLPSEASTRQLLPTAQGNYALGMSSMMERCGATLVQHYINGRFDNYGFDGSSYSNQWAFQFYGGALQDFKQIINQGSTAEEWHHVGIAKIQTAYIFSVLVDLFGDIPFSEALQAKENFSPALDKGEDVYPQLILMIEEGMADLEKDASLALGGEDLIYAGNLDNWKKMGNTLKLKLYNQTRLVDPAKSKSAIENLLLNGTLIRTYVENFSFQYTDSRAPEGRHPNFQADYASGSVENNLSAFFISLLTSTSDPRIPYYFYQQRACSLMGLNGGETSSNGDDNDRAIHGAYPVGGRYEDGTCLVHDESFGLKGAGVFPMLTNTMRAFIEAEAALMLNTPGDVKQLLEEGIKASFEEVAGLAGVAMDATAMDDYINARLAAYDGAASDEERLEVIMMEKYVALFGNGYESYNDLRRTQYPENLNVPISQNGPFPLRLPIPPIEVTANENIDPVADLTKAVFWDIN